MRKVILSTLAAAMLAAFPVKAQDLESLTPDQLQKFAIEAVNKSEANELMNIMREMQRREMHFFRQQRSAMCEREPKKVGFISQRFGRFGTARQAYFTYLREVAMRDGVCSCLMGQMSFDEFLTEKLGIIQEDLDEESFAKLQEYLEDREHEVSSKHRAFQAANCREND